MYITDSCISSPCGNAGSCITLDTPPGYKCLCYNGPDGTSCPYSACMSHPCYDRDVCVEASNEQGYMCCSFNQSSLRYSNLTGHNCFPCSDHPCGFPVSRCVQDSTRPLGYYCNCSDGTIGDNCSHTTGIANNKVLQLIYFWIRLSTIYLLVPLLLYDFLTVSPNPRTATP